MTWWEAGYLVGGFALGLIAGGQIMLTTSFIVWRRACVKHGVAKWTIDPETGKKYFIWIKQ